MAYGVILGQKPVIPSSDFPIGGIIIWSGSKSDIPTNWQLCDGTNGTPDLRGQFIVGAGGDYAVGNTGGESEHTLTIAEMPSHHHGVAVVYPDASSRGPAFERMSNVNFAYNVSAIMDTGGSQPHNNLPPYYALCYIMKIA